MVGLTPAFITKEMLAFCVVAPVPVPCIFTLYVPAVNVFVLLSVTMLLTPGVTGLVPM